MKYCEKKVPSGTTAQEQECGPYKDLDIKLSGSYYRIAKLHPQDTVV